MDSKAPGTPTPTASAPSAASRRSPVPLDMSTSFAGITLKNPVMAAAGTFGYGVEFEDVVALDKLGGFVVKGLSREPMPGNPPPRLWETSAGMLNAIGLQNIGARAFLEEKLPILQKIPNIVVIANVFGYSVNDYEETIQILNAGEGIAAYELNVSCPNTAHGGISFGQDPALLRELVWVAKHAARRPLIVKLSPNVTSIPEMARAAEEGGADAISLVNTFTAMAIDPETRLPRIANITAGLSGPAIKPIALRMVYEAAHAVKLPVIGTGRHQHRRRHCGVPAGRSGCSRGGHSQFLGPLRLRKFGRCLGALVPGASRAKHPRADRRDDHAVTAQATSTQDGCLAYICDGFPAGSPGHFL